ncbi:hypothetical protein [Novosphingobium arvoryzae]|uniref:hypothetical protein n=1 Tax=Novosphingobium arvoryzae TaxID=1256514 RepID=UPI0016775F00|nr:hypothetical protein [Novosphingobium arvoryzae]
MTDKKETKNMTPEHLEKRGYRPTRLAPSSIQEGYRPTTGQLDTSKNRLFLA